MYFGDCEDGFSTEQAKVTCQSQVHFIVNTEHATQIIAYVLNAVLGNAHIQVDLDWMPPVFSANTFCDILFRINIYIIIIIIIITVVTMTISDKILTHSVTNRAFVDQHLSATFAVRNGQHKWML